MGPHSQLVLAEGRCPLFVAATRSKHERLPEGQSSGAWYRHRFFVPVRSGTVVRRVVGARGGARTQSSGGAGGRERWAAALSPHEPASPKRNVPPAPRCLD